MFWEATIEVAAASFTAEVRTPNGVCLLIQHMRSILTPADGSAGRLYSKGMREVLGKSNNGLQLTADKIGPMPSLSSIIANEFV